LWFFVLADAAWATDEPPFLLNQDNVNNVQYDLAPLCAAGSGSGDLSYVEFTVPANTPYVVFVSTYVRFQRCDPDPMMPPVDFITPYRIMVAEACLSCTSVGPGRGATPVTLPSKSTRREKRASTAQRAKLDA
jgi:hypothetical protein